MKGVARGCITKSPRSWRGKLVENTVENKGKVVIPVRTPAAAILLHYFGRAFVNLYLRARAYLSLYTFTLSFSEQPRKTDYRRPVRAQSLRVYIGLIGFKDAASRPPRSGTFPSPHFLFCKVHYAGEQSARRRRSFHRALHWLSVVLIDACLPPRVSK